ncbi:MAG: HD domain-containing protein [Nitrospirae bacterium]|nr:HD domain-containing protein [Nitrospirota bacterium]
MQPEAPKSEIPSQPSVPTSTGALEAPRSLLIAEVLEESVPPVQAPAPVAIQPAVDWYIKAEAALLVVTKSIRMQQPFSLGDLPAIASGMATSLVQDDTLMVRAISHQSGPSLVGNLVHTAIFALKIGMGMGYRSDELSRLALASLVHDLGMFLLPEQMLDEAGRWSKDRIDLLHNHPVQGAELLRRAAPDALWISEIVMQEHERLDGTGYPKGLKGPQIHEMALVIGMADVLDAMLRTRLNRKAMLPHEAVRLLLSRERAGFPTRAFKSLLNQFSLFPSGTWVKLSSGDIGSVVQSNPRFPLRPIVKVVIDQVGLRLREPREIDLCKTPLISVLEIVDKL